MKELFLGACALLVLVILAVFFCNFFMFVFFEPFLTFERGIRFVIGFLVVEFLVAIVDD